MPLIILFAVISLIEIYVLIQVGGIIGGLATVALVVLTAMVGVTLLRAQGLATLMRARTKLEQGSLPAKELAEGFLLALAGAMLLTPGFVTDSLGFALLVPGVRRALLGKVMALLKPNMVMGAGNVYDGESRRPGPSPSGTGRVIEGDYIRRDQD